MFKRQIFIFVYESQHTYTKLIQYLWYIAHSYMGIGADNGISNSNSDLPSSDQQKNN